VPITLDVTQNQVVGVILFDASGISDARNGVATTYRPLIKAALPATRFFVICSNDKNTSDIRYNNHIV